MPPLTPSRKPPAPTRKSPWLLLAALVAIGVIALAYFWTKRPAPAPIESAATPSVPTAPAPIATRHIYSQTANPAADIAAALAQARRERKRVLLDFGGDWCGDCQVLDIYFHQAPNAELLEDNFVLVHVWIGHMDANLDVPEKYRVPIKKGVPALAVLAADGKVLYAQDTGQFEDMRHMESTSVTEFLQKWKA